jgi:hypothetical protein
MLLKVENDRDILEECARPTFTGVSWCHEEFVVGSIGRDRTKLRMELI